MGKIGILLHKEWLEFKQQRMLILGIVALPLLLTLIPLGSLFAIGAAPSAGNTDEFTREMIRTNPVLAGMSEQEAGQAILGQAFSTMFLLLPMILPSIIAAYSIVGEKANRTLEPLLATPLATWELLTGKILASLIPTLVLSWLVGLIFIVGVRASVVSERVFAAIISLGWLTVFLLCTPFLALIAIAAMVAISSRTSDPRTAQQYSGWIVVPFLAVFFSQLFGLLVLSPLIAILAALVLALIAGLAVWGAVRLFQRETILTRWS